MSKRTLITAILIWISFFPMIIDPLYIYSTSFPPTNYPLLTEDRDITLTILCDIASEAQKHIAALMLTQLVNITTQGLTPSETDKEVGILPSIYATSNHDLMTRLFTEEAPSKNMNQTFQAGGFDLALIEWVDVPWTNILSFFDSSRMPQQNFFFLRNDTIDSYLWNFTESASFSNRNAIISKVSDLLTTNYVSIPLSFPDNLYLSIPDIQSIDCIKPGRLWNWQIQNTLIKNVSLTIDDLPSSLCPLYSLNSFNYNFGCLIYDSLYEEYPTGEIIPNLATNIPEKANGTEWTVFLVDNATFSDGKPFSADDVVFTFNAMRNDSNFVYYDSLKWLLGNLSSSPNAIQKIHDTAIKFTTRFCESNELLLALQIPIYPAHLLQSYSATTKTWSELSNDLFSVGTGPFILKNTNSSQKICFQRRVDLFQNYHRPTRINSSVIDTFNIIKLPTYDTAMEKFSIGEVHALSDRYEAGRRLSELKKDSYTKHNAVGRKILALFPNHNHPILYNKNIRKVFAQLLNLTSLTMASYSSYASPANSFIAPSSIFHNTSLQLTPYSSADASISFTLGIQELIGDGILKDRDGDGLPDPISIITTSTQTAEEEFIFIPFLETLVSLVCVSCFYFHLRKLKSR